MDIREIVKDYFRHMRSDLRTFPLIITLIVVPLVLASLFYFLMYPSANKFYSHIITVSSILIPLLLNLLMIVYYSLEKTKETEKDKIGFLEHINSTISMTILVSVFVLFLAIIFAGRENTPLWARCALFYLIGFLIINVIITLVRIYRLIRYEIYDVKKYSG